MTSKKTDVSENTAKEATSEDIQKLGRMIDGIEFAMLTTSNEEGELHSRPMMTQKFEFNGELWFLTSTHGDKIHQIEVNPKVNVAYVDPSHQRYVSIAGTAKLLQDQAKIQELWNPLYKAWFPKGLDDPHLAALCIQVEKAEYWDAPSSTMAHLYGFVKASLTGRPARPGDHGKLEIAS